MNNTWLAFLLATTGGVGYQISQKLLPLNIHPIVILAYTYITAFIMCVIFLLIETQFKNNVIITYEYNWAILVLAVSTILIELGYLYAFRMGASLSTFGVSIMATVAVILFIVGIYLFHEVLTIKNSIGILLCILGVALIK